MADLPGAFQTVISDRYRIQRELGRGGMAVVYLARDIKLERDVAIKVLRPEFSLAIGAERFLREVDITARLSHPNVLPLLDSGDAGGTLFYVMPFVGDSLSARIAREKQLSVDAAVQIAREIAAALSHAHAQGIIHRDIKPDNILLSEGHARVADFGIARAAAAAGQDKLTVTGVSIGTPAYMSPEQAAGNPDIDERADLYALACTLYESLAGQPPFVGPTSESVVHQHVVAPPPDIRHIRPGVPEHIAGEIRRALGKSPADRHATVAEFVERISRAAAPAPRRMRRRLLAAAAIVAVAVLGVSQIPRPGSSNLQSVAVLPFRVSGDSAEARAYLADGMSEALITRLTKIANLRVVPWMTSERFRGSTRPLSDIAQDMGVDRVLTGSLRTERNIVRVTVALIDPRSGSQLWGDEFDEQAGAVFEMERRVAVGAATELAGRLSNVAAEAVAASPSRSAEAYELYLRAKVLPIRADSAANNIAGGLAERAIAIDSLLTGAHVLLSEVMFNRYYYAWSGDDASLAQAEASARRALRIDPRTPAAYEALESVLWVSGRIEQTVQLADRIRSLRWETIPAQMALAMAFYYPGLDRDAVPYLRRVVSADPANARAHSYLVAALLASGEPAQALVEDSLRSGLGGPRAKLFASGAALKLGDVARAERFVRIALDASPNDFILHYTDGILQARLGRRDAAEAAWRRVVAILDPQIARFPHNTRNRTWRGLAYAKLGRRNDALDDERAILAHPGITGNLILSLGRIRLALGDVTGAVQYWQRAVESGVIDNPESSYAELYDRTHPVLRDSAYVAYQNARRAEVDRLRRLYVR